MLNNDKQTKLTGIILAGGDSTELWPYNNVDLFLKDTIKELERYCDEIIIVSNKRRSFKHKYVKDNHSGTFNAALLGASKAKHENILMVPCDCKFHLNRENIKSLFERPNENTLLAFALYLGGPDSRYGNHFKTKNNRNNIFIEKPTAEQCDNIDYDFVELNTGIYAFTKSFLDKFKINTNESFDKIVTEHCNVETRDIYIWRDYGTWDCWSDKEIEELNKKQGTLRVGNINEIRWTNGRIIYNKKSGGILIQC